MNKKLEKLKKEFEEEMGDIFISFFSFDGVDDDLNCFSKKYRCNTGRNKITPLKYSPEINYHKTRLINIQKRFKHLRINKKPVQSAYKNWIKNIRSSKK